ncbi:MAG: D-alanyl-D-alanine carboxypeptidase [Microcystaceae cyanobacterium]
MLTGITLTVFGFLGLWGTPQPLPSGTPIAWEEAKIFDLPTQPDPVVDEIVQEYLRDLAAKGYDPEQQGIWMQSEWAYLVEKQAHTPRSAASLTKVATTLAALNQWGLDHRFSTRIYRTGTLADGTLQGDLIIVGGYDPLFVWEEAIALGNALNELGIQTITGNLIITGPMAMNFKREPELVGSLVTQAWDAKRWSGIITKQYEAMPPGTPRPQITVQGSIQSVAQPPDNAQLLLTHQSLTLGQLLKQMNIYSNNEMAEILAEAVGGAEVVMEKAIQLAKIPPSEIQLKNGSGLAVENRLSPQAVTLLYRAIQTQLQGTSYTLADLFPVMGRDRKGTLEWRSMPKGLTVKTGTLNRVSALAGIIPTQERGMVWFSIINSGPNFDRLRAEQDKFLQRLATHWQILPTDLTPGPNDQIQLGDPGRLVKNTVNPPQS